MPYQTELEAGQIVYWCACGKSKKQPFCDGSHRASGVNPLRELVSESKLIIFCTCKKTANPPYCDGAHSDL